MTEPRRIGQTRTSIKGDNLDGYAKLATNLFIESFRALRDAWYIDDTETARKELKFLLNENGTNIWHHYLDINPALIRRMIEQIREEATSPQ